MEMTIAMYGAAILALAISFFKNREKTAQALKKAWKAFENILPQLLGILVLMGLSLAALDPAAIGSLIGEGSGWWGTLMAALVGAITLIPGFVAFPMAALLLQRGAGTMQIAAFVSTLMMVGVVTFPMERKYFGTKAALLRNLLAFGFSFLVAFIIDVAVKA
jgi:uncharacterized membrane protein YraQ (UPF0718 family)